MKKGQRSYKTTTSTELDYVRVIKISIGVLLVFALVYLGTALLSGEIDLNKDTKKENKETVIQYQEIIAGSMLNRKANEYYVLIYDFSSEYNSYFQSLITEYSNKDNSLPFYTIDLGKKVNEDLKVSEENKEKVIEWATLKVEESALVKISNGKIVEVVEGNDKVVESLQNK